MPNLRQATLDLLAPPRCPGCGGRTPVLWCRGCSGAAERRCRGRSCALCGGPPTVGHACWRGIAPVAGTVAVYDYGGVVARTIVAGKVRGAHRVWPPLGRRLGAAVMDAGVGPLDVVVPVPSRRSTVRQRGFEHSVLLASAVASVCALPHVSALTIRGDWPDQARRPVDERHRVPLDALRPRKRLHGAAVLLVDDVLTTGATAASAAAALGAAGATRVHLAVIARAGSHELFVDLR